MEFNSFMLSIGFHRNEREPCIYVKSNGSLVILLLVYVDDILITGSDTVGIHSTLELLQKRYIIKNLDYPSTFLNINIVKYEAGQLFLHQATYVESLLKRLNIQECNSVKIPMVPYASQKSVRSDPEKLSLSYRQIIGAVLFVANFTRPDVAYAVSYLARHQLDPQDIHWTLLKRLLQYLSGTRNLGLWYNCNSDELDAFVDADFGGDPHTRKSTTGFVIRLFGCPIAWASRIQTCIAESSAEAENNAICDATHDVLFVVRLSEESLGESFFPVTLYEDNTAAISISTNVTKKSRVKHVELKYLKVREYVNNKLLKIVKIGTENQLADIFTKGFSNEVFLKLRSALVQNAETISRK